MGRPRPAGDVRRCLAALAGDPDLLAEHGAVWARCWSGAFDIGDLASRAGEPDPARLHRSSGDLQAAGDAGRHRGRDRPPPGPRGPRDRRSPWVAPRPHPLGRNVEGQVAVTRAEGVEEVWVDPRGHRRLVHGGLPPSPRRTSWCLGPGSLLHSVLAAAVRWATCARLLAATSADRSRGEPLRRGHQDPRLRPRRPPGRPGSATGSCPTAWPLASPAVPVGACAGLVVSPRWPRHGPLGARSRPPRRGPPEGPVGRGLNRPARSARMAHETPPTPLRAAPG